MKLIYVAGKYTSYNQHNQPNKAGIASNIYVAEIAAVRLWKKGWAVLCPHKNTEHFERYEDDYLHYSAWINGDIEMLRRCDAIFMLENWQGSSGAKGEHAFAKKRKIPIFYEEEGYPEPSSLKTN